VLKNVPINEASGRNKIGEIIMNKAKYLVPILTTNIVFLIFSWWRFYSVFYIFCGDNTTKWKSTITLYFITIILLGWTLGYFLSKLSTKFIRLNLAFIILVVLLSIINLLRLTSFFLSNIF
jgi:hypothetical protein